jgi:hypothetical protein
MTPDLNLPRSWSVERHGTDSAPWCVIHRATGFKVPALRPYPGVEDLPPIEVCNFRSRAEAEKVAQGTDWAAVDAIAATPGVQAAAARYRAQRDFDAAYQIALRRAREGLEPWPWQAGGLMHREPAGPESLTLFDLPEAA